MRPTKMAAIKIIIIFKKPSTGVEFEIPIANRMGQPQLRFNRPAVGAQIYQL